MTLQVGVKILLRNKQGKFLLGRRNPKIYPDVKDHWDIVGGRIDPGSSLLDNLKREVKEETGLDFTGQPKLIAAQDILLPAKDKHVVRLTYVGDIEGEPRLDEENLEFKWMTLDEIKSLGETLDKYFREVIDQGLLPFK